MFGQVNPRSISFDQISKFRDVIREAHGVRAAHRTIKIWRALSKINALNKLCDLERDPSNGFQNHAAEGRNVYWLEAQARALGNKAWSLGYCGFAAVIAIMWDTQLSPVDVRSLKASQFATAGQREIFFTSRAKTAKPVGGMLQARSMVRLALYGADETRTMADFRRSGAIEAVAGKAAPADLSHTMGNSLDRCHALFKTYCPVNVVSLRAVKEARAEGAKLLAQEEQNAAKSAKESERTGQKSPNGPDRGGLSALKRWRERRGSNPRPPA